jgi:sulfur carrier protein
MNITVNGQSTQLPEGATVADLLEQMDLPATRVAVERNEQLIRRAQHAQTPLADGDQLEVVTLVGGG